MIFAVTILFAVSLTSEQNTFWAVRRNQ